MTWRVEQLPIAGYGLIKTFAPLQWAAFRPDQWGKVRSVGHSAGVIVDFEAICRAAEMVRSAPGRRFRHRFGDRGSSLRQDLCLRMANVLNGGFVGEAARLKDVP